MDIEEYKASMPRCKDCTGFGWGECKTAGENEVACKDFERKPKLTNADRIRQMTDEELAAFIDIYNIEDICRTRCAVVNYHDCMAGEKCKGNILLWLKQEVKTNDKR